MSRLWVFLILISTPIYAQKRPIGILPMGKNINSFYRTEIMKIAVHVILKGDKFELFLNSDMSEKNEEIVDFIKTSYRESSKSSYNLKLVLLRKGESHKHVKIVNISEENLLYYSRLGLYELLYGKKYVRDHEKEIKEEFEKNKIEFNKRASVLKRNKKKKISLFNNVKKKKNRTSKVKRKIKLKNDKNKVTLSKEERINNEIMVLRKKRLAQLKRIKEKKMGKEKIKKNTVRKNDERTNEHRSSIDESSEKREYVKSFNRKSKMSVLLGQTSSNKTTTHLLNASYNITEVYVNGRYELPLKSTENDSMLLEAHFRKPLGDVSITISTSEKKLALENSFGASSLYQMHIDSLGISVLLGGQLRKTQFVNLAEFNSGLEVGMISAFYLSCGLKKDFYILNRESSFQLTLGKMFMGSVNYSSNSEKYSVDGLVAKGLLSTTFYKNYGASIGMGYETNSIREVSSFSDSGMITELGLLMYF